MPSAAYDPLFILLLSASVLAVFVIDNLLLQLFHLLQTASHQSQLLIQHSGETLN